LIRRAIASATLRQRARAAAQTPATAVRSGSTVLPMGARLSRRQRGAPALIWNAAATARIWDGASATRDRATTAVGGGPTILSGCTRLSRRIGCAGAFPARASLDGRSDVAACAAALVVRLKVDAFGATPTLAGSTTSASRRVRVGIKAPAKCRHGAIVLDGASV